jgi:iron(III) transport system ATP-binding protein
LKKIIEANDVVKMYGKLAAVDHLSFSVDDGEILSLLGPSGCGKTTALRAIAGLEEIDSGEIRLDGKVVTSKEKKVFVPPEKRDLGLMFQSYALWPHMNVFKNIAFALKIRKMPVHQIEKKVKESLELVGLSGLENRYPSQLSGGQQQRVALARNLAYEPKVLLLDEPLSNLDFKERERMRGELGRLLRDVKMTAMYVTHDQEEAFVLSDRIILMRNGKIEQEGTAEELYEQPRNFFVANFIGRSNAFKAKLKNVNQKERTALLEVPDLNTDLLCNLASGTVPDSACLVVIRPNEIGIYPEKPEFKENIVEGKVVEREFRGSVTDHRVAIGNGELLVTTHRFCVMAKHHGEEAKSNERRYLYIPPGAITIVPCD